MTDTGASIPTGRLRESLRLPDETVATASGPPESIPMPARAITFETQGALALAPVIDIERLYEAPAGTSSQMVRALELLKQMIDLLAEANKSADPIETDTLTQRAQLGLPKLFSCRSIGDGFGVVVNSLHFAFKNLRGMPLTSEQLSVMWRVLRELRARPVLSLEEGIQCVEELEEQGLEVDPSDISDLLDEFSIADK
jgi:hypothetical protein